MIIYLDESGDLGFDFKKSKTSRYFVLTVLICDYPSLKIISKAVKKTLKNKFFASLLELKGTNTPLSTKKYFLKNIQEDVDWKIYAVIADKKMWLNAHRKDFKKASFYDEMANRLISSIDFKSNSTIEIVVDRSKTVKDIKIFNEKILLGIQNKLFTQAKLSIGHRYSHQESGLQAVDLFCWGIYRKYENADFLWYENFADRIGLETIYKF